MVITSVETADTGIDNEYGGVRKVLLIVRDARTDTRATAARTSYDCRGDGGGGGEWRRPRAPSTPLRRPTATGSRRPHHNGRVRSYAETFVVADVLSLKTTAYARTRIRIRRAKNSLWKHRILM